MSLGVVLRSTDNSLEVEKANGRIATNNTITEDAKTIKHEKILQDYLHSNNEENKKKDDKELRDTWIRCRSNHF